MEQWLEDAKDHLVEIAKIADNITRVIEKDGTVLEALKKEISSKEESRFQLAQEAERESENFEAEKKQYSLKLEELDIKKSNLESDIKELIDKKASLKVENTRLSEENAKFKAYESKAVKALEAKEESLIVREQAVEQKEGLSPRKRSLLPPIE